MFFKLHGDELCGLMVVHVDDTLWAGDENFITSIIKPLKNKFLESTEEHDQMQYLSLSITRDSSGANMRLNDYVQQRQLPTKLGKEELLNDTLTGKMRMLSGQFNWLAGQSRPDLAYSSCQVACSLKSAKLRDLKYADKIARRAKGVSYNQPTRPWDTQQPGT